MANRTDILSRLRSYEVAPPADAFQTLMNKLGQELAAAKEEAMLGAWQGLQELDIPPPATLSDTLAKAMVQQPLFATLQEHAIMPPAGLFNNILEQTINTHQQTPAAPPAAVRSFVPRVRAVAAVILLMMAGYTLYNISTNKADTAPPTAFHDPNQGRQSAKKTQPSKQPNNHAMARFRVYDNPKTENYFVNDVFVADGSGLPLVDNDFMVTFASYEWDDLPAFLYEEEENELMVRLDQYSYFTISENMMNNLRKMYQHRANGTPTRKAKRELARLEKWKQADEAQFDKKHTGNPLDPIDLAEFIFDY